MHIRFKKKYEQAIEYIKILESDNFDKKLTHNNHNQLKHNVDSDNYGEYRLSGTNSLSSKNNFLIKSKDYGNFFSWLG